MFERVDARGGYVGISRQIKGRVEVRDGRSAHLSRREIVQEGAVVLAEVMTLSIPFGFEYWIGPAALALAYERKVQKRIDARGVHFRAGVKIPARVERVVGLSSLAKAIEKKMFKRIDVRARYVRVAVQVVALIEIAAKFEKERLVPR